MGNEKKSSIVKDALIDFNAIKQAAEVVATKKLVEEHSEKFNNLLKEEILNKNKSKKESSKDEKKESDNSDENKLNKESVMKNKKEETNKVVKEVAGEGKPFDEKAKNVEKVDETAGEGKPFDEKVKKTEKVDETAGKGKPFEEKAEKVKTVEEAVTITDTVGDGAPFKEKVAKSKKIEETNKKDKKPLQTEEFDITELDVDSVGSALENAENDDEVITMDEIEKEISEMNSLGEELNNTNQESSSMKNDNGGIAFNKLVNMRKELDEMINSMNEMHKGNFANKEGDVDKLHNQGPTQDLVVEKGVEEMHTVGGNERFGTNSQVAQLHQGNPLIDEEGPITDDDIEAVLGGKEGEVDEAHGLAYSARRNNPGRHLPDYEHLSSAEQDQAPEYVKESKKKIGGLIGENKNLTKKLNETKKYKESVTKLIEQYKSALEKYRNQLREMAIFNTNLAHVNNLLVNEELALTQDDKIKIINEFKKVNTIADSQKTYKTFLTEMKESKKTLTESIENKVSVSIQPSSKQKLDEVVEKTAYSNDEHINKMKRLIEYVEHRDKKIIK